MTNDKPAEVEVEERTPWQIEESLLKGREHDRYIVNHDLRSPDSHVAALFIVDERDAPWLCGYLNDLQSRLEAATSERDQLREDNEEVLNELVNAGLRAKRWEELATEQHGELSKYHFYKHDVNQCGVCRVTARYDALKKTEEAAE